MGLGTMGAGIAQVCLEAGHAWSRAMSTSGARAWRREASSSGLAKRVEKGGAARRTPRPRVARLTATTDLTALSGAGIVIEAIVEELGAEAGAVRRAERASAAPDAILATNTCALSVSAVAAASGRPERVVGLHFFNPAPLMKLIEVVRTQRRRRGAFADALEFASGPRQGGRAVRGHAGLPRQPACSIPILNDAIRAMDETRRVRPRTSTARCGSAPAGRWARSADRR